MSNEELETLTPRQLMSEFRMRHFAFIKGVYSPDLHELERAVKDVQNEIISRLEANGTT